jgi:hypothetical protein
MQLGRCCKSYLLAQRLPHVDVRIANRSHTPQFETTNVPCSDHNTRLCSYDRVPDKQLFAT